MPSRAGWLELAASGMDLAGLAAGGWYLVVRGLERDRRSANRRLAELNELKESAERVSRDENGGLAAAWRSPAGPDARQSLLIMTPADPLEIRGGEATEAEELLTARMLRSGSPLPTTIFDAALRWWELIWRGMRAFGWFRVPLLAPMGLVLFIVFAATCVIRLPAVAIGYLLDAGNDFRLRIIVLAFALGLVFQVLRVTIGQ